MPTPTSTFCLRCGQGITGLPNNKIKKCRCPECGTIHYGLPDKIGRARACGSCERIYDKTWKVMAWEDWECMPSKDPCPACKEELTMMANVVKQGGIYWRCNKCHHSGVVGADSELSKKVRLTSKTPAPDPVGIDFDPEQCPVCSGKIKLKEDIDESARG